MQRMTPARFVTLVGVLMALCGAPGQPRDGSANAAPPDHVQVVPSVDVTPASTLATGTTRLVAAETATSAPAETKPPAPTSVTSTDGEVVLSGPTLVQLTRGRQAYLARDLETAKTIFEQLRTEQPNNPAVLYFLGLIYMDLGLEEALRAAQVTDPKSAEARAALEAALANFRQARDYLESVTRTLDPELVPVEALLDVGIAQLAASAPGRMTPEQQAEAIERARRAEESLSSYLETEIGRTDRNGFFFRAVARYRRYDLEKSEQPLSAADQDLDQALALADQDQSRGALTPEELNDFRARARYYRGLNNLGRVNYADARTEFEQVVIAAPGTTLANNAEGILKKLAEVGEGGGAPAIMLPGKLRFDGELSLGYAYDSNVILLGRDTLLPRRIPHEHDTAFGLLAGFDVSRQFRKGDGILGESLNVGVGFTTSHTWHPSIVEFDINYYNPRAYVNWEPVKDLFIGLQYDYSYTQLGHAPFISSNRITPVISKIWRGAGDEGRREEVARTDFYYVYDYRDYKDVLPDPRLDRDGDYHAIGFTQRFNLTTAEALWRDYYAEVPAERERDDRTRPVQIFAGYIFRNESTQGDEFDLYGNGAIYGFSLPLPWRLSFDFRGEATFDNYWQPSLFDFRRNERFDFFQRYEFALSRILVGRGEWAAMQSLEARLIGFIELTIQDNEIWDRLGQDIYDYERAVYGVRLQLNF